MHKKQAGYTLIELLVVTGLLSLLIIGVSSLFINTLTHKAKLTTQQEMKLEGDYVIDQISFFVRNAKTVACPTANTLSLKNMDDGQTTFGLADDDNGAQRVASISSYTAFLSSQEYSVTRLSFSCDTNPNRQIYVTINLELNRDLATADPISRSFSHTALQRNPASPE